MRIRKYLFVIGACLAVSGCAQNSSDKETVESITTTTGHTPAQQETPHETEETANETVETAHEAEETSNETEETAHETEEGANGTEDTGNEKRPVLNGIPVIYIDIDESKGTIEAMNSDAEHNTKCKGSITVVCPDGYVCPYGEEKYSGGTYELSYIRGRGNSTWGCAKKPYKIKFKEKTDLFNMGADKTYALLSNPMDGTYLKDRVTYEMASDLGLEYSPGGVNVDVVMNGTRLGNYYLCETVSIGKARVAIDNLEKEYSEDITDLDLTGGYLIGMHMQDDGHGVLVKTKSGKTFNVFSPRDDEKEYKKANEYISDYLQRVENAIYGISVDGSEPENIWDLMDKESTIKYYLIQEYTWNTDAYTTNSTYLYKTRDHIDENGNMVYGKLYWGPVWDFDLGFGETDRIDKYHISDEWIRTLMLDEEFAGEVIAYWDIFKAEVMKYASEGGLLERYMEELTASAAMEVENDAIYYNIEYDRKKAEDDYRRSVTELKEWMIERKEKMDSMIEDIRAQRLYVDFMVDGKLVYTGKGVLDADFHDLPPYEEYLPSENGVFPYAWKYMRHTKEGDEEAYFYSSGGNDLGIMEKLSDGYHLTVTGERSQ